MATTITNFSETSTITAHGTTLLTLVYTNEEWKVNETLAMFEKMLDEDKSGGRFVGLDLEYTPRGFGYQRMAVVQLAVKEHVLVYHYCRGSKFCPELREFLQKKQITFVSVDTSRDIEMLSRELIHIPKEYHVDLQVVFGIKECGKKAGMGDRKSTRLNSSHSGESRMPSSA